MVRVKKEITRSDTSSAKTKAKQRNQRYLKYQKYLRSKQFKIVKQIVFERDGGKCMFCGRTRNDGVTLNTHHRCYKHLFEGGIIEANDCILVCSICHKMIHSSKKNYRWFSMELDRNKPDNEEKLEKNLINGEDGNYTL